MIVTLSFVSSINGKITKGTDSDVTRWTSKEDQEHFRNLVSKHSVLIRSSSTYKIAKSKLDIVNKRNIIMTRNPGKYRTDDIVEKLEFTNETPRDLIKRLEDEGIEKVLLAVGGKLASLFLKENLVNEFYLTIEPVIFGEGVDMFSQTAIIQNLKLIEHKKLNDNGTVLLKYSVLN